MSDPVSGPGFETIERNGRQIRRFRVAVSAGAMALAWSRQEHGPAGAAVVADREVYPLGRIGTQWQAPPEATLACAVILRPRLPIHLADAVWLIGALACTEGAEAVTGKPLGTWWPDAVVEAGEGEMVASVKAEVQLGPGAIRSAVLSMRLDLSRLGLEPSKVDDLLDAVLSSLDRAAGLLDEGAEGCAQAVAAYSGRCLLLGKRVKVTLMPKGETRGIAHGIDDAGQLEVTSSTGMVERITIDMLRRLEVVPGSI